MQFACDLAKSSVICTIAILTDRTYAVGFGGGATAPEISLLAGRGHECGRDQPEKRVLGGASPLQTSLPGGHRVTPVTDS